MSAATPAAVPDAGLPRLLAGIRRDGLPLMLDAHAALHGPLPSARGLIDLVSASGLCGRGGGGFPTGTKLAAVASARRRPVVVANGAEGEPVSAKDKLLLHLAPHLMLDGAALAAGVLGAREVFVALSADADEELGIVENAMGERRDRGLCWRLVVVPSGFVTGEETALVAALEGREAKPAFTPPRPFERGLRGAPTLVQNVETLAHIALIARHGPEWFRALGTREEPGSALFTVSGAVVRPGVYEAAFGTALRTLVAQAGGVRGEPGGFLVGGFFGRWVQPEIAQGHA